MDPRTEALLRKFLDDDRAANAKDALKRIEEGQVKIGNMLVQHDAEDRERFAELRGDMKGLSLRVGALERSDEKMEDRLEESGRWNVQQVLEERVWLSRNWPAVVSAVIALGALIAMLVQMRK